MCHDASAQKYTSNWAFNAENTKDTLSGMLALLIDRLEETQDCYFCRIRDCKDSRCLDIDLCRNLLFDGVLNAYMSSLENKN